MMIDLKKFKESYAVLIKDEFEKCTKNTFSENAIYCEDVLPIKYKTEKYNGGFRTLFIKFIMKKMGGLSSRCGLFYEKRLIAVDDVLTNQMGISTFGKVKQTSKIHKQEFPLPKGTCALIQKYSKLLYKKEATFENFEEYLKTVFNYMVENMNGEHEKITHDIDNVLKTKTGKTFIIESKTKERGQNFDAWGDVGKTLETWACLTYQVLLSVKNTSNDNEFNFNNILTDISWDTVSILYLMNDIIEKDITSFKYFPVFSEEVYEKGGVIAVDTFYKFFYGIDYESIVEVEEILSKGLDMGCLETILYFGKVLYEDGKMDFYPELLNKYVNMIK